MKENRKGFILSVADATPAIPRDTVRVLDNKGQKQVVKQKGHSKLLQVYPLLRPVTEVERPGKEQSMHLWVTWEKMQPGGRVEELYFEYNSEMPIFDLVIFVISGRIRVTIGDVEKIVGADTLVYFPSNVKNSLTNVGKGFAKYLVVRGSGEGEKMGGAVYSKMPSWISGKDRKLAGTQKRPGRGTSKPAR